MKTIGLLLLIPALALALAACVSMPVNAQPGAQPTAGSGTEAGAQVGLVDTRWQLISFGPVGAPITGWTSRSTEPEAAPGQPGPRTPATRWNKRARPGV